MKAFYGSRISPNQTRTPEGFLICHNVPIARTGWMQYLGQEVNRDDLYDKLVDVYRSPEEVFSPAAIASFEGKSVTDGHPQQWVGPDNYASFEKGQVMNVRQGSGDESDCLVADLMVKDPTLISEIESGKREVSCGYSHDLQPMENDKYQQTNIRGNHVAIVPAGRAGDRIAIKDQRPTERRKKMSKALDQKSIWAKMFASFAKDAEPEELVEASKMGPKEEEEKEKKAEDAKGNDSLASPPVEPPKATDEPTIDPAITALTKQVEALAGLVKQVIEAQKPEEKDGLDELIGQLENPESTQPEQAGQEESVTVPAETMSDAAPVSPPEERPKNPIPGADRNAILTAIKAVKPIIAAIPDAAERKKAADSLAKTFRDQIAKPSQSSVQASGGYGAILTAQQATVAKAAKATDSNQDPSQLGKEIAKKFNPHYKEAK